MELLSTGDISSFLRDSGTSDLFIIPKLKFTIDIDIFSFVIHSKISTWSPSQKIIGSYTKDTKTNQACYSYIDDENDSVRRLHHIDSELLYVKFENYRVFTDDDEALSAFDKDFYKLGATFDRALQMYKHIEKDLKYSEFFINSQEHNPEKWI